MPGFLKRIADAFESLPERVQTALAIAAYVAVVAYSSYVAFEAGRDVERISNQPYYERGWNDGVKQTINYFCERYPSILEQRARERRQMVEDTLEKKVTSEISLPSGTSE